jgi:excisionase family DNA binding protein
MEKAFYTVAEIIEMTGLGRTKVYEEINSNSLKAKKCGARTLVAVEAFHEWRDGLEPYTSSSVL